MQISWTWLLACALLLAGMALLAPVPVGAEEDQDVVDIACRGVIAELLHDLRSGDEAARAAAVEGLRARARFALPYLLSAVESTSDADWRARCRALAAELREAAGPDEIASAASLAELPDWEQNAGNALGVLLQSNRPPDELRHILDVVYEVDEPQGLADLATRLLAYAKAHPDQLLETLRVAAARPLFEMHPGVADMMALEKLSRTHADTLPREQKAEILFALARWWRRGREGRLEKVASEYADTQAGLRAAVEKIRASDDPVPERVGRLVAFAEAHPGTVGAREALENVAFHLASVNLTQEYPDPLDRFRALAAVAARLQSAEFPGSEGAIAAARHMNGLFLDIDEGPEASARALLDAYRTFYRHHFLLDVLGGEGASVGWSLVDKLGDCHEALGVPKEERARVVDAELTALESVLEDKAGIRYLRAEQQAKRGDVLGALYAMLAIEKAYPDSLYARKALAARALFQQVLGAPDEAEALYDLYLERHPASGFAWLAALRRGHLRFEQGDVQGAIARYQDALSRPGADRPPLTILASLALGRAYEAAGDVLEAARAYRRALDAWPPGVLPWIGTQARAFPGHAFVGADTEASASRVQFVERLKKLDRPGVDPEDVARLARGDWFAERGDREAAVRAWASLVAERPGSAIAAEARSRIALLWVLQAVKAADRTQGTPDAETFLASIAKADETGDRFGGVAAALAHAAFLLRSGDEEAAHGRLDEALKAYAASQAFETPPEGIPLQVAQIREAMFVPRARAEYDEVPSGAKPLPYVTRASTVRVVHPDGSAETLDLMPPLPHVPNLLYFRHDQVSVLGMVLTLMGAQPESMEKGAEPLPGSEEAIAKLLGRFLAIMHGHWGGWLIGDFPMCQEIRLVDDDTAQVNYRIGYGGATVRMQRQQGVWKETSTISTWIE